ncbi:hypothetical protein EPI10_028880 [Gossypium australe]|uniref:Uncharacterized protein n=1 Tax=Gossypium australe TaxID=47621 RepID=A0A5B6UXP6_9ROSI|nr:hypothetical protein EPI10_028880 [Gossypium australe]
MDVVKASRLTDNTSSSPKSSLKMAAPWLTTTSKRNQPFTSSSGRGRVEEEEGQTEGGQVC